MQTLQVDSVTSLVSVKDQLNVNHGWLQDQTSCCCLQTQTCNFSNQQCNAMQPLDMIEHKLLTHGWRAALDHL